ncbi:unnamed protein product [Arabis nemorensis]|uniref:Uncharacterized protein n=1 Tax=Arabis nemorensis TaxID=586526 RepID=A0A565BW33_9BRAS|nr:unnamed protein product [Arabis nemorensis]
MLSFEERRGVLMVDAMILPCGHTFGAGRIEQVKQMGCTILVVHGIVLFVEH